MTRLDATRTTTTTSRPSECDGSSGASSVLFDDLACSIPPNSHLNLRRSSMGHSILDFDATTIEASTVGSSRVLCSFRCRCRYRQRVQVKAEKTY